MSEKDLLFTPLWFIILSGAAFLIRPLVTDENTRRYFMPALMIRFVAAILLGVLYQFYYGGGDTFNFHTHGSAHIFQAFTDDFMIGLKLLFANGEYLKGTYEYASRIWFFHDPHSYMVIRISAFFDLLTFGTYSATALFFAAFSFSGMWVLYRVFYQQFPDLHRKLAIVILFIPSVVFWGSGILKDTITLGAIGWLTWFFYQLFIRKRFNLINLIGLVSMILLIYLVKVYLVLAFLPALLLWYFILNFYRIESLFLKVLLLPLFMVAGVIILFYLSETVAAENPRYALTNIAETARITAYDIRYGWGARYGEGAGYSLGELDGTWQSMLSLAPSAVNVSLFRPYIWEVKNPLMALAAAESLFLLLFTVYVFFKNGFLQTFAVFNRPVILFALIFSILFAFAVGISTFNFGTLMRYKIPLMPFFATAVLLVYELKRRRKSSLTALTEYRSSTV